MNVRCDMHFQPRSECYGQERVVCEDSLDRGSLCHEGHGFLSLGTRGRSHLVPIQNVEKYISLS